MKPVATEKRELSGRDGQLRYCRRRRPVYDFLRSLAKTPEKGFTLPRRVVSACVSRTPVEVEDETGVYLYGEVNLKRPAASSTNIWAPAGLSRMGGLFGCHSRAGTGLLSPGSTGSSEKQREDRPEDINSYLAAGGYQAEESTDLPSRRKRLSPRWRIRLARRVAPFPTI